jgi:1-acyl-sn-glycerol-3-phosphate acyltransferase
MHAKKLSSDPNTPIGMYVVLWFAVWLHVLRGVMTLLLLFPFINSDAKKMHVQRWSKRLLKIFGIQLQVTDSECLPNTSYLLVANHVSWMDIHVINSFRPIRFVAKSEVRQWPIFGWMAKELGTVFIRRDSAKHARQVVGEMGEALQQGSICIFPEGTSTIGKGVEVFKPNLFESAVVAKVPVCAMAIAYFDRDTGKHSEVPAFVGDMGLLGSMANILKNRHLRVELQFFQPFQTRLLEHQDRKWLSQQCQDQIGSFLTTKCQ